MTNPINPRVDSLNRSTTASVGNEKAQAKSNNADNTTGAIASEDTVSLSQESQQVASLQQQLKDSSAIDQVKVDAIKQEIANGNYPLDTQKIAENLINLEQSLIE